MTDQVDEQYLETKVLHLPRPALDPGRSNGADQAPR